MAAIGLNFYSFKIFTDDTKKDEGDYKKLYEENVFDIGDYIYSNLKLAAEKYEKEDGKEQISKVDYAEINQHNVDDKYYFSSLKSIIKSGSYGVETEIIDSEDGTKAFTQTKKQAGIACLMLWMIFRFGIFKK